MLSVQAARREMERQRQLEWERQRRDLLTAEKLREQGQVERLQQEVGQLKLEFTASVSLVTCSFSTHQFPSLIPLLLPILVVLLLFLILVFILLLL